jgi:hypothetical protein
MNLRIQIPERLKPILTARAAECVKDVETFVIDAICEQLEVPIANDSGSASEFDSWLVDVQKLVPSKVMKVDDSRDSIYAGRGQ